MHAAPAFTVVSYALYNDNRTDMPVIIIETGVGSSSIRTVPAYRMLGGVINTNRAEADNGHRPTVDT